MGGNRRPDLRAKANTRKIIGRLTYSPVKHKNKHTKALRSKLCAKDPVVKPPDPPSRSLLTFGSLNVNGLDAEAHWAVSELVKDRDIDVSEVCKIIKYYPAMIRFLLSARRLVGRTNHGLSQTFLSTLRGGQRGSYSVVISPDKEQQ